MSGPLSALSPRSSRILIFAAAVVAPAISGLVAPARADEPPADQGIAAAKRDYSELKAATSEGSDLQKLALPKTLSPAVEFKADLGLPLLVPQAPTKNPNKSDELGAKSKNWLVDAMMAKPQKTADKNQGTFGERPSERLLAADNLGEAVEDSKRDAKTDANEKKAVDEVTHSPRVVNPLQTYLATWMTPQDFALLKPAASRSDATPAGLPTPFGTSPVAESGDGLAELVMRDSSTNAHAVEMPGAAPTNPYLAPLSLSPSSSSPASNSVALTAEPTFHPAPVTPLIAAPSDAEGSAPRTTSPAAEFQKAQDDAKYFKQLKRF